MLGYIVGRVLRIRLFPKKIVILRPQPQNDIVEEVRYSAVSTAMLRENLAGCAMLPTSFAQWGFWAPRGGGLYLLTDGKQLRHRRSLGSLPNSWQYEGILKGRGPLARFGAALQGLGCCAPKKGHGRKAVSFVM